MISKRINNLKSATLRLQVCAVVPAVAVLGMAALPALAATSPQKTGVGPAGSVPRHFAAVSVTFVSPREAFVLGTAPCAVAPCTSIVQTLNRGRTWRGLPAPMVRIGAPGGPVPAVWGVRFFSPSRGFLFGTGLWATSDGGAQWRRVASPRGSILALATIDGQLLALTAPCRSSNGCGTVGTLARRPLGGGSWSRVVATVRLSLDALMDPTDEIATQAAVAAILDGTHLLITSDGGINVVRRATPCPTVSPTGVAESAAVTSARGLALLCIGQGFSTHTIKKVYLSGDSGRHWHFAGMPPTDGVGGTIAAATSAKLTVATGSFADWLYHSADSGRRWQIARTQNDDGLGWADLGFTTTTDGVVVTAPARTDGNPDHRPGQLLLTSNGGATWQLARF